MLTRTEERAVEAAKQLQVAVRVRNTKKEERIKMAARIRQDRIDFNRITAELKKAEAAVDKAAKLSGKASSRLARPSIWVKVRTWNWGLLTGFVGIIVGFTVGMVTYQSALDGQSGGCLALLALVYIAALIVGGCIIGHLLGKAIFRS